MVVIKIQQKIKYSRFISRYGNTILVRRLYYDIPSGMLIEKDYNAEPVTFDEDMIFLVLFFSLPALNFFMLKLDFNPLNLVLCVLLNLILAFAVYYYLKNHVEVAYDNAIKKDFPAEHKTIKEMADYKNMIIDTKRKQRSSAIFIIMLGVSFFVHCVITKHLTAIGLGLYFLFFCIIITKDAFVDKDYKTMINLIEDVEWELAREYTAEREKAKKEGVDLPPRITKKF